MEVLLNRIVIALTVGLELAILYRLTKGRLQRRFFWFLAYIVYELCELGIRFATAANRGLYFKVYWLTAAGGVILTVLAVRESFLNVFRLHTRLRWFSRVTWGCVGLALLYAVLKAWLFPPVNRGWQIAAIIGSETAVEYSISAVAIVYFVSRPVFRIKGQEWESGIVLGFAIYEILALGGFLTRSIFGTRFSFVSEWLPAVAYIIGEITWLLELSQPEPEVRVDGDTDKDKQDSTVDQSRNLGQYIRVLQRALRRKT